MEQVYELRITRLGGVDAQGRPAGGRAEIAISKGGSEVHVEQLIGMVSGGTGYRRIIRGEPGLTARLKAGDCSFGFGMIEPKEFGATR
ncbi:hypothetical protein [Pseudomonas citronellolis]|uniref:hypothetical protein n=1 Tax=Pseudomonas citronellolis TaxID=53408 RepID=UPI000718342A|nr:hypothetical protein [Pseudomonas citronellolis]KRV76375.1 hypothetical protein AO742_12650 [Pseudomonas citronellolis]KRW79590.1 hypothetical protein AO738_13615 [Pseudomonas citronellolis]